jgi:hypothetical protein
MPELTPEQVGSAFMGFTSVAGVTAAVLAVVCIALAVAYVWERRSCRAELKAANDSWIKSINELVDSWGKRIDQIRGDTKDAFGQNAVLADKMVEAMNSLKIEIARMSARRGRDD